MNVAKLLAAAARRNAEETTLEEGSHRMVLARTVGDFPISANMRATLARLDTHNPAFRDTRRAQNLEILLVGMKLSIQEWRQCVLTMTFDAKFAEKLKMLMGAWPTSDEERAIQAYDCDRAILRPAEAFLVGLRDIPRLKEKIKCLPFRLQFSSRAFELRESVMVVEHCIKQITEKETFAGAMQYISALCSLLNCGVDPYGDETESNGFRFSTRVQLLSSRFVDLTLSVLQAVVAAIENDYPELGPFAEELTLLPKCAHVSVEALHTEYALINVTLSKNAASDLAVAASNPALVEDLERTTR